jgi:hypothetical protein
MHYPVCNLAPLCKAFRSAAMMLALVDLLHMRCSGTHCCSQTRYTLAALALATVVSCYWRHLGCSGGLLFVSVRSGATSSTLPSCHVLQSWHITVRDITSLHITSTCSHEASVPQRCSIQCVL